MLAGAAVTWRLDQGWRIASKTLPSHGCQVDADCWQEASVLCHMDFFVGLLGRPHDTEAGFPHNEVIHRNKAEFTSLVSEFMLHHY